MFQLLLVISGFCGCALGQFSGSKKRPKTCGSRKGILEMSRGFHQTSSTGKNKMRRSKPTVPNGTLTLVASARCLYQVPEACAKAPRLWGPLTPNLERFSTTRQDQCFLDTFLQRKTGHALLLLKVRCDISIHNAKPYETM